MKSSVDNQPGPPQLPTGFADQAGRQITVKSSSGNSTQLGEMYAEFDTESISQGVPPRTRPQIDEWLTHLLTEGINVVALHETQPIGHAVLLPHDDTAELAIFVHPDYQSVGIGTQLIRGLLGKGRAAGIDHAWLAVARDNRIAIRLYQSAKFEIRDNDRGELEMEREL